MSRWKGPQTCAPRQFCCTLRTDKTCTQIWLTAGKLTDARIAAKMLLGRRVKVEAV